MLIGDSVTYNRRSHVVIGFTPVSVTPALLELRDPRTGATVWVEPRLVTELVAPERAALRLIPRKQPRRQR